MGCFSSTDVSKNDKKGVKSDARLEYELNTCFEHYSNVVNQLKISKKNIMVELGRNVTNDDITSYFQLSQNKNYEKSKTSQNFEKFCDSIEQGKQLLPMLISQVEKIRSQLKEKKQELQQLLQKMQEDLQFCNSIIISRNIPSIQSTEH